MTHETLKSLLGHAYDVMKVDAAALRNEPWEETCSLLVIPGGRDKPYCDELNGPTNRRIRRYVEGGGCYVGFCAGGYYGSHGIEFEKGVPGMAIVEPRELGFFPGTCKGTMFPGFVYNSERGARSVAVKMNQTFLQPLYGSAQATVPERLAVYHNGGGYFEHADQYPNVDVLCTYEDAGLAKGVEENPAAAIYCRVGEGHAVLMGIHPEYNVTEADLADNSNGKAIVSELITSAAARKDFLGAIFRKIGLNVPSSVSHKDSSTASVELELTPIYLAGNTADVVRAIASNVGQQADAATRLLKDAHDTFYCGPLDQSQDLSQKLESLSVNDPSTVTQILYPSTTTAPSQDPLCPPKTLTRYFDTSKYFEALRHWRAQQWGGGTWYRFGNAMLYGEVVTSTQTLLDKNYTFSQALPSGLVCTATHQVAGRGRGRNSWVSQRGAVQFSLIVRHSLSLTHAPVVFIQYMISLAVIESIRSRKGYEDVPLRLKWPNDIYADLPADKGGLKKVGGLLVNSSFSGQEFLLVIGCGINLSNAQPTVSINDVIKSHNPRLAKLEAEDVLAGVIVTFENYYLEFCEKGMGSWFLDTYYRRWLHSDKLVTLTTHDNVRARIVGITKDWGMLEAVGVDDSRQRYTLQPDGNSFDMLKGLIIKKT
ncbi:biotin-protein ligase [Radiomyces spectabilis]|uniref:biotin-protein ligase n=1 Tax=Radiomyces spectabilis TaxID=64574 RepID=UPI00221F1DE0|nr:biotin-protein ligase [Radiomyces spectabilis]KAI8384435.1 biotin-protein ligase [Radiomyces spectabilis]